MEKRPYEHLIVWQEAHKLCLNAYKLANSYPDLEKFALCSQTRRSAYSIPMNIVEGNTRNTKKDRMQFFRYSQSSLEELDYQMLLARDLGYISSETFQATRSMIGKVSYLLMQFKKAQ